MKDTHGFLKKHRIEEDKFLKTKRNIEFARDLFSIWDEDGSGKLEHDELAMPLIALGLSSDSTFVKKILRVIDAEKFLNLGEQITIEDFAKIFKNDKFSEKVVAKIKEEVKQRRREKLGQA